MVVLVIKYIKYIDFFIIKLSDTFEREIHIPNPPKKNYNVYILLNMLLLLTATLCVRSVISYMSTIICI